MKFLNVKSVLGGQKIEGFVVKNYKHFTSDGKTMMGKFVSEQFKEVHKKEWKNTNPTQKDILTQLGETYKSEARWYKAIQHLKESGAYTRSPKDIGPLLKEIQQDIKTECQDEIKEKLFKWAWSHVARKSIQGFPQWYKELLMEQQFTKE
jgi:hypothetical protein